MLCDEPNQVLNAVALSGGSKMSEAAFSGFQKLIFDSAGISISPSKTTLVSSRLGKRLRALDLPDFDAYLCYLTSAEGKTSGEFQQFVNLLTTNETYFFRESQHFDFLRKHILPNFDGRRPLRIWSAASSSGEEAYTIAMVLADELGVDGSWEIHGTDISTRMIQAARRGIYNEHRVRMVPKSVRYRYLMKGKGEREGYVAVVPELREHVKFEHYNLVESPAFNIGFDVIFCRNVLIYFEQDTKMKVVDRLCPQIRGNGFLLTGHSESLHGMNSKLSLIMPSVYQKLD